MIANIKFPTGIVELDLQHAKFLGGFYVENSFVMVNGYYEGKVLQVASVVSPPGEEYKDSRPAFGNLNYFGGNSTTCLRESQSLKEYMFRNPHNMIFFFSDVWLDHPQVRGYLTQNFTCSSFFYRRLRSLKYCLEARRIAHQQPSFSWEISSRNRTDSTWWKL